MLNSKWIPKSSRQSSESYQIWKFLFSMSHLPVNPLSRHRKNVCLVDLTGQNRLLPGLKSKRKGSRSDRSSVVNSEAPRSTMTSRSTDMDMDPDIPWKVGFSETSGMRNKLCVATLKLLHFRSENESVFGMFDGGHNNEVPSLLLEHMEDVLLTEQSDKHTSHSYMKYAMLNAHG